MVFSREGYSMFQFSQMLSSIQKQEQEQNKNKTKQPEKKENEGTVPPDTVKKQQPIGRLGRLCPHEPEEKHHFQMHFYVFFPLHLFSWCWTSLPPCKQVKNTCQLSHVAWSTFMHNSLLNTKLLATALLVSPRYPYLYAFLTVGSTHAEEGSA